MTAAGKERKIIKWLVAVILILLTLVLALAPAAWQWHKAKSREEALLQDLSPLEERFEAVDDFRYSEEGQRARQVVEKLHADY